MRVVRSGNFAAGHVLLQLALLTAPTPATLRAAGEDPLTFFESKIRPLLIEHCLECHSTDTKQQGGLLLDSRAGWQTGGDNGPAIIPGDPEKSLLIRAVRHADRDLLMPPKRMHSHPASLLEPTPQRNA
jgi:hypothetical protein